METVEDELRNFTKVVIIVLLSLTYCYFISSRIPKGKLRLLSVLPVISILTTFPLILSSFILQFYATSYIVWLANFKLVLFAFGKDDNISINPSIPLLDFILVIAFPIKIKAFQNNTTNNPTSNTSKCAFKLDIAFVINALLWSISVQLYVLYKEHVSSMNPIVVHILYSVRMFFGVQIHFSSVAALSKLLTGQELEPQFNNPYLSTSLGNLWSKRWNLMMSKSLKSAIHEPTRSLFTPLLGRRWAIHPAILATYVVSGLMHELIHFYVGRKWPTWEVMWFFIIHGLCVTIEVEIKKKASKIGWKLHPIISTPLTVGFVIATGIWLCIAELIHCGADVREIEEYVALVDYVKHRLRIS
ncbi:Acyl-coa--sterol o-acyltransferase [Thalictrum thalictroides]|uniref:Acyl-coa--sterol o-acyltransferase n=1 Tax=Thalictrum thalictroides TaxID=46969 RepID=A0A7J6VGH1_THATH|nr:Acyl-coa--sterol o-acyltransferase [Thalictrum thalictroides]